MIEQLNQKIVAIIQPTAINDDSPWTAVDVDTLGWRHLTLVFQLGAADIAVAALKAQECDTSNGTFADISGADFSVSPATLPSATDDNKLFAIHVDLKGKKRYIRLVATAGNGAAGSYASAFGILSRPEISPSSASGRGFSQELFV